jgi:class 3 adenylate cyclase/cold shock CspA family protein
MPPTVDFQSMTQDLSAAFQQGANGEFTAVFFDLRNSLESKVTRSPATWLSDLGFLYSTVRACKDELVPDAVIKFAGDGVIVVANSSHAAEAINCAIKVVEAFAEASAPRRGQFTGDVSVEVSVGIATGELLQFQPPEGGVDHVGPVMDIAARLCAMASPNAILVDTITVEVANMGKVSSRHGVLMRRTPAEYRGDRELVKMKGIPDLFAYHEVLWEAHRFGIRSEAVTEAASSRPAQQLPPVSAPTTVAPGRGADDKKIGTVKTWLPEKGFGFVTDASGEDFHFSPKSLVYPEDAELLGQANAQLAFRTAPALQEGKSRRAVTVLVIGGDAEGRITHINRERHFAFVDVSDDFGSAISVYMSVQEGQTWAVGDEVSFEVASSPKGPRAVNAERVEEDQPESAA